MNERRLSELQKEYRAFFLEKMRLYDVESPARLTKAKKGEFFTEVKQDWAKYKLSKKPVKEVEQRNPQPSEKERISIDFEESIKESVKEPPFTVIKWPKKEYLSPPN